MEVAVRPHLDGGTFVRQLLSRSQHAVRSRKGVSYGSSMRSLRRHGHAVEEAHFLLADHSLVPAVRDTSSAPRVAVLRRYRCHPGCSGCGDASLSGIRRALRERIRSTRRRGHRPRLVELEDLWLGSRARRHRTRLERNSMPLLPETRLTPEIPPPREHDRVLTFAGDGDTLGSHVVSQPTLECLPSPVGHPTSSSMMQRHLSWRPGYE